MSGRVLDPVRIVRAVLGRHLGEQFNVAAPDLASLRAMYGRGNTLFEHQQLACEVLDLHWLSEQQRRALSGALRLELTRTRDRQQLLIFAQRWLYELGIHRHFADVPDDLLRRYARRLANRPPSIGARIKEPLRTIESAYFLRFCLLIGTDRLLLMVRRRVADLWRHATTDANRVLIHWANLYRELLTSVAARASDTTVADTEVRDRLRSLVAERVPGSCQPPRRSISAGCGGRCYPVLIVNKPCAPSRSPPCWRCAGHCVTAPQPRTVVPG